MSGYDTGLGGSQDPPVGSGYVPAFDGSLTTRSSAAPRARDPFDPTSQTGVVNSPMRNGTNQYWISTYDN